MIHNLRDNSDEVYMHSLNVSLISNTLASWMRLSTDEIELATAGGLLHDIGKMLVPQELVNKKTPLTHTYLGIDRGIVSEMLLPSAGHISGGFHTPLAFRDHLS